MDSLMGFAPLHRSNSSALSRSQTPPVEMIQPTRIARWFALFFLACLSGLGGDALAGEPRYQIQLVWGTDDPKADPGGKKPLDEGIRERLRSLRWKSYFVVKSEVATVTAKESKRLTLSDRCAVELKELPNGHLEVKMFSLKPGSEVKEVASKTMSLKELNGGNLIIYAGDSKDRWDDAWLVIVGTAKPVEKSADKARNQ